MTIASFVAAVILGIAAVSAIVCYSLALDPARRTDRFPRPRARRVLCNIALGAASAALGAAVASSLFGG